MDNKKKILTDIEAGEELEPEILHEGFTHYSYVRGITEPIEDVSVVRKS